VGPAWCDTARHMSPVSFGTVPRPGLDLYPVISIIACLTATGGDLLNTAPAWDRPVSQTVRGAPRCDEVANGQPEGVRSAVRASQKRSFVRRRADTSPPDRGTLPTQPARPGVCSRNMFSRTSRSNSPMSVSTA
jgi:hypothetical protein